jgi:hypothetical protein
MRFTVHVGNHLNPNGIGDTATFLRNALRDCGRVASISHGIVPGEVNLVMEHFVDARHLRALVDGRAAGARYVLIGTEPIVNGTFNGGIDAAHWHYSDADNWKARFDGFRIAAGLADAIWVLAESMVPAYRELFPHLPVRFLPHGWVSDYATVRHRPDAQRDIDFYFSGSLTEHRTRLLGALSRHHRVVCQTPMVAEYLRLDHLARSKVCLSLRLSERNDIPSVSRMHFHLQNRNFLLHEAYALPCPLDPYVPQASTDDLVEWAVAALRLPDRAGIAASAHERFKADLPMSRLLPPLLDEALAHIGRPASAPLARAV